MKNILTVLLLTLFSFANAQTVSDYKYIIVPRKFADFEKNSYKLDAHLKMYLREKKYIIIVEGVGEKPADLKNNPCLAAKANIQSIKSTFKNKLKVIFTDCNEQVIEEFEGISSIKEFDKGYQEALKFASQKIKTSSPTEVKKEDISVISFTPNQETTSPVTLSKTNNTIITNKNKFSDGIISINVNTLENGDLVLSNGDRIIAQFRKTLKPNVYVATVNGIDNKSYASTGYTTENSISFEYLDANNQWQNRVFYTVK